MIRSVKRGFTLIELLVVIAIIAILAAILFPVFAQARAAARGASSQSNQKQLSLAVLMYVQDYDETYPLFQRWGKPGTSGFPISFGSVYFSQWSYDIAPYLKNVQVFSDPLIGPINQSAGLTPLYTYYGYDYTALSPVTSTDINGYYLPTPASLASVARPSSLVMIAGRATYIETQGLYWYGPGTMVNSGNAEAPDCSDIPPVCWSDWAPDGNDGSLPNAEAGLYTGGVSLRKALNANLAFCDGHVKFMPAGQAAIGTNWFKGIKSGQVHILKPTDYMWEASP